MGTARGLCGLVESRAIMRAMETYGEGSGTSGKLISCSGNIYLIYVFEVKGQREKAVDLQMSNIASDSATKSKRLPNMIGL